MSNPKSEPINIPTNISIDDRDNFMQDLLNIRKKNNKESTNTTDGIDVTGQERGDAFREEHGIISSGNSRKKSRKKPRKKSRKKPRKKPRKKSRKKSRKKPRKKSRNKKK